MGSGFISLLAAAIGALVVGLALGWLAAALRLGQRLGEATNQVARTAAERDAVRQEALRLSSEELQWRHKYEAGVAENSILGARIAGMDEQLKAAEEKYAEMKKDLLLTFQSVAGEALKGNNEAFLTLARQELGGQQKDASTELEKRQIAISSLLEPLKLQLQQFRGKVEEVYEKENNFRIALSSEVQNLSRLSFQLSRDAENLTKALKGSSKAQGNWGELILERILETVGWREGHEYHLQESFQREDGSRGRPDVVVHLPDDRHLVIDAKVSLTAYQEYGCTDDEVVRGECLKRHLDSIRHHIRDLAARDYQKLHGLNSLDYVVIFVPIETAFMLAISSDINLWEEAWEKNVLLVSPSTLLFMVRTVAHLWRQEDQSRNAQQIASRGADLYDKLVGFVEDVESIGNRLKQASESYDKAYNKLATGNNNLIRQADKLRSLGVKPTKSLTQRVLALAGKEDDEAD